MKPLATSPSPYRTLAPPPRRRPSVRAFLRTHGLLVGSVLFLLLLSLTVGPFCRVPVVASWLTFAAFQVAVLHRLWRHECARRLADEAGASGYATVLPPPPVPGGLRPPAVVPSEPREALLPPSAVSAQLPPPAVAPVPLPSSTPFYLAGAALVVWGLHRALKNRNHAPRHARGDARRRKIA